MENNLKRAIDTELSRLRSTQSDRARILNFATEEKYMKKKFSMAFVLTMIFVLLAAGAAAAALLGGKDFVNQFLAPMAQKDESTVWTREQTDEIIRLAEENGLTVPDDFLARFESADVVYKESLMRAFAKLELGEYPAAWSMEDQAWYDETLVACGLLAHRTRFLPQGDEISREEALSIARAYMAEHLSCTQDVTDATAYMLYCQYMLSEDDGAPRKMWDIEYVAADPSAPSYVVCVWSDGTVYAEDGYAKAFTDEPITETAADVKALVKRIEDNDFYTVENMASFQEKYGDMIDNMSESGGKYSALRAIRGIPYALPREGDLPLERAFELALAAIKQAGWTDEWLARCKHTVSFRAYNPAAPEWRVCYKIGRVEDYHYCYEKAMPFGIVVNLDAATGAILSVRQLDEMDTYDYYCELPDPRDVLNTIPGGVG